MIQTERKRDELEKMIREVVSRTPNSKEIWLGHCNDLYFFDDILMFEPPVFVFVWPEPEAVCEQRINEVEEPNKGCLWPTLAA
jgi:hypothetical protein